ncbi:FAD:protein FMN transferase [Bifidobacterium jacchi]|nr:FAD:protein FMN transferase [Bifidobacterium jacchi]
MPLIMAFPDALGTGLVINCSPATVESTKPPAPLRAAIAELISEYERTLSRFRADSLVAAMGRAEHGGRFAFPEWARGLFDLVDLLNAATGGAIDPCVGEDLTRLGYGVDMSFAVEMGAAGRLGSIHGRPTWRGDVRREGTTLVTSRAVHLDFGACGKGYLVDLIGRMLLGGAARAGAMPQRHAEYAEYGAYAEFVIDAGGDLLIHSHTPVAIALEDPADASRAIGVVRVRSGALCASAPSRRHWRDAAGHELHHLLNAIDGMPVRDIAASWAFVPADWGRADAPIATALAAAYPTAFADGVATALFVMNPGALAAGVGSYAEVPQPRAVPAFDCLTLDGRRRAMMSAGFPVELYTR